MAAFELNHRMHHVYADTKLDPTNPKGQHFLFYLFANSVAGTGPVRAKYYQFHGKNLLTKSMFDLGVVLHFFNGIARFITWLVLLGPAYFCMIYLVSFLFNMFVFAHLNYYTHIESNGKEGIKNLNSNLYYKLCNKIGDGLYYHKNHHLNPNIFNPAKLFIKPVNTQL